MVIQRGQFGIGRPSFRAGTSSWRLETGVSLGAQRPSILINYGFFRIDTCKDETQFVDEQAEGKKDQLQAMAHDFDTLKQVVEHYR